MLKNVKRFARPVLAFVEYMYDFRRYVLYSGWSLSVRDKEVRNYYLVKIYHSLEKSMSFSARRQGGGKANADLLLKVLEADGAAESLGYHDKVAPIALKKWMEIEGASGGSVDENLLKRVACLEENRAFNQNDEPGVFGLNAEGFRGGMLSDPEAFFHSRYSLREFSNKKVDEDVVNRALTLAIKSPSVCNRQAWHLYHLDGHDIAQTALRFQDGNRGFGDKINSLLIVTTDLRAFVSPKERYQHWIDGGMFSMSIIWALHSLGVASCCLNWSQSGRADMALRAHVPIEPHHSIIMMIAIGYPNEDNMVCRSLRRPVDEFVTRLS
jgi:nitroreductase